MATGHPDEKEYLRTAEVARLLSVSPKTVTRWAHEGKLPFARTLGGHRRFPAEHIRELAARSTFYVGQSTDDRLPPS